MTIVRRTVAIAVLTVFGGACGGGAIDQGAVAPATSSPPTALPINDVSNGAPTAGAQGERSNEIPDAVVRDVSSGAEINIRSLAPAPEPLFFWFYAPH